MTEIEFIKPKQSGTFNNIVIDDLPGSTINWEWAKSQGICTGNGTQEWPYIIEGHTFTSSIQDNLVINNSDAYVRIQNCVFNNFVKFGLRLDNVSNCIVFNNSFTNYVQSSYNIWTSQCNDINISKNNIVGTDYLQSGIYVYCSSNYIISKNTLSNYIAESININYLNDSIISDNHIYNTSGIRVFYSENNNIINNNLTDNKQGINIYGEDTLVSGNNVSNNNLMGIYINGNKNTVSGNKVVNNTIHGIFVRGNFNNITGNIVLNGTHGINLTESEYNIVLNNNISSHINGINLYRNNHSTIVGNSIYETNNSINLIGSNNNSILENGVNKDCTNLLISWEGASIIRTQNAITMENCSDNEIVGNNISYTNYGTVIKQGNRNNVSENVFHSNSYGFILSKCNSSQVSYNIVQDSLLIGVNISNGNDNFFFNNFFVNNTLHALDNNINNFWNNSIVGNYWDDYEGTDRGDGIGSTAYVTGNINDQLPLCKFYFNTQLDNQIIGRTGPEIDIVTVDPTVNSITYMLINSTNIAHHTSNYTWLGFVEQAIWDQMGNGTVEIQFFINNSYGHIVMAQIILRKDIISPSITVNNPSRGIIFSTIAPNTNNFTIVITDPSGIDSICYLLINGTNGAHHTLECAWNGYIEQKIWDQMGNGTVIVHFMFNDTVGNTGTFDLILEKNLISSITPQEKDDSLTNLIIVLTTVGTVAGVGTASGYVLYSLRKATKLARKLTQRKLKKLRKKKISKDKINKFKNPTKSSKEILNKLSNKEKLLELFKEDVSMQDIAQAGEHPLTIVSEDFLKITDNIGFSGSVKEDFIREILSFSPNERTQMINDIISGNEISPVSRWKKREEFEDILVYEGFVIELIQEYVEKHKKFDPTNIVSYLSSRFSRASININQNGIKKIMRSLIEKNIVVEGSILTKNEILKNTNRYTVFSSIQKNPGIHLSQLLKKTSLSSAVVRWHLNVLERFQFIRGKKVGNLVAYYDQYRTLDNAEVLHIISREKCKRIIKYLQENTEGCQLTEISQELGMHYNTVKKYLDKLDEFDLISIFKTKFYQLNRKKFEEINTHSESKP
ncbi:MAG: right-handed parallel beta-helix repeat-containing protein [Candidatus Lokiarchaeota archaeon]|nr:right-handed parallel beta-helix repeat-containing protein [Candidatus Lokiarchaeota archaeon]